MAIKYLLPIFVVLVTVYSAAVKDLPVSTRAEVFRADFSKSSLSAAFGGAQIKYGNQNAILWASGGGVDVVFPAGSWSPEGPIVGGFGVWTRHQVQRSATMKFSVFFPENFNFVHGGKLPGLYGGKQSCAGGDPAVDCFSTRVMWRDNGDGELYLYANREAQDPAICQMPGNYCGPVYGWSLSTGAFRFQRGAWTDVQMDLTLNTAGQRNGIISVKINGVEKIRYNIIVFRTCQYPNLIVDGVAVDTFFGGTGEYWATPTRQVIKFRDIILNSN